MGTLRKEIVTALVLVALVAVAGVAFWLGNSKATPEANSPSLDDEAHSSISDPRQLYLDPAVLGEADERSSGSEQLAEDLGWKGEMLVRTLEDAWMFDNYSQALEYYPDLVSSPTADTSKPVFVCAVKIENKSAVALKGKGNVFDISFLSLSDKHIPVSYFDDGAKGTEGGKDFGAFTLDERHYSDMYVGFSVPESWNEDRDECYENAYLFFGHAQQDRFPYIKMNVCFSALREDAEFDRTYKDPDLPSFYEPRYTTSNVPMTD